MAATPDSPRLVRGGIVVLDAQTGRQQRVLPLPYNPATVTRTLQTQSTGGNEGRRDEALRLTGPAVETWSLEAVIDAADYMELDDQNPWVREHGIQPILAALEGLLSPSVAQLQDRNGQSRSGSLEVLPMPAPLTLFVWNASRIMPVVITEFRVTEEAFNDKLNPLLARVSLGMRVLNVADLGFSQHASGVYLAYLGRQEELARIAERIGPQSLGIGSF